MARVVCVHGLGRSDATPDNVLAEWFPALAAGMTAAGAEPVTERDVAAVAYADLLVSPDWVLGADLPYGPQDVAAGWEQAMLSVWWRSVAAVEELPGTVEGLEVEVTVAGMLREVSGSPFFEGVSVPALVRDLKQMRRYLFEPELRGRVRDRALTVIGPETRVVVAHSFGSVIAYEALCAIADRHRVRAFVTLGAPLGIPRVILDGLRPPPVHGVGRRPGPRELVWTNIADSADVIAAAAPDLRPAFGEFVRNTLVYNESHAYTAVQYLADELTGQAVADGLAG